MRRIYRRPAGLAVFLAAAAIGLAACSSGSSTPQVASLRPSGSGNSTGSGNGTGSSTAGSPKGNPTLLVDEWAACMRSHGDPDQADPTIDASKEINVVYPVQDVLILGLGGKTGSNSCSHYMNAASTVLSGGNTVPSAPFDMAQALKLSECMRANGVPDFPDPSGNGLAINQGAGGDLNPSNPTFQKANKLCAKKTGMPGFNSGNSKPVPGSVNLIPVS